MIPTINGGAEPPDPGLKNNRSAPGSPAAPPPPSTAGNAINNVLIDRLFGRLSDLSGAASNDPGKISTEQRAGQYTDYARASILERPASAMAAQANQMPQTVLQLLQ